MTLKDLEYIFQPQIEQCLATDTKMWFILKDGDHNLIGRHYADDLEGLLPMLDSFQYAGNDTNLRFGEVNIPRFEK